MRGSGSETRDETTLQDADSQRVVWHKTRLDLHGGFILVFACGFYYIRAYMKLDLAVCWHFCFQLPVVVCDYVCKNQLLTQPGNVGIKFFSQVGTRKLLQ